MLLQAGGNGAAFHCLNPSSTFKERPFGMTADGCQKVNHYVNCGKTMSEVISPQLSRYLGACNLAADNAPSKSSSSEAASSCTANLACAREFAAKSGGVTDIKVLITATCLHTCPGKGLFIAAKTNEQFYHYDLLLAAIMPERMPPRLAESVATPEGRTCCTMWMLESGHMSGTWQRWYMANMLPKLN